MGNATLVEPKEIEEIIKQAQSQPGISDLMNVYRDSNTIVTKTRSILPKPTTSKTYASTDSY